MKVILCWVVFTILFFGSRPIANSVGREFQVPPTYEQVANQTFPNGGQRPLYAIVSGVSRTKEVLPWAPLTIWIWPFGMLAIYGIAGINAVKEWDRRPVYRFGRYIKTVGPGFAFVDPLLCVVDPADDVSIADSVVEFTVRAVQSHDNVPVMFVLVITTRIDEDRVRDSVVKVLDIENSLLKRALAACAAIVSNTELDSILHDHGSVSAAIVTSLRQSVKDWGVTIVAVELRDVGIADKMISEAIAMKARASKEGDAEIVRAQKQEQVATSLSHAAGLMTEGGWRLKELEVLTEMTRSAKNNTVIPASALDRLAISLPGQSKQPVVAAKA